MIMVALLAIAAIAVVTLFGGNIRALLGASSDSVAGQTQVSNPASKSSSDLEVRNLKNFAYSQSYNPDNPPGGGPGPGSGSGGTQ
jgi:hypothetical protein